MYVTISTVTCFLTYMVLQSIVKMVALSLVGAECHPIVHVNKTNQRKRGVFIDFPDHNLGNAGERAGESRKRLIIPNWKKTSTHRDNFTLIEAIVDEAGAMPVGYSFVSAVISLNNQTYRVFRRLDGTAP